MSELRKEVSEQREQAFELEKQLQKQAFSKKELGAFKSSDFLGGLLATLVAAFLVLGLRVI